MNESLKKTLEKLPSEELLEIASYALDLQKEREPAVTLHIGQIVEWDPGWCHNGEHPGTQYGFIEKDIANEKRPQVIQYLAKYKCFRMTYVDASKIIAHKEYVNIAPIFNRFEELAGGGNDESVQSSGS